MTRPLRLTLLGLWATLAFCKVLPAQQPQTPQVPPAFQLNQLEQTYLDQVLDAWERASGKVTVFECDFQRQEFNAAFGPAPNLPLTIDKGKLSYQKPDKGSFQITEVRKWQAEPIPPGQPPPAELKGDWVVQPDAIGEHWVCDGKAIFEYRHDQKQLVVRPIPNQMQGKAIVDGPLPFLFGAEAAKLKQRFWMRVEQPPKDAQNANILWVQALPKFQVDAANYRAVEVMLDRQSLLPSAMQVHLPDGGRHLYTFDLANASVNNPLARIQSLFQSPSKPWGWKRVVEEAPPEQPPPLPGMRQAAEPGDAPR